MSYTSMIPAAKERSGMAEWNSILITMNTSVVQIFWLTAHTSSMITLFWGHGGQEMSSSAEIKS
ncbi:hypothetical protein PO909_012396 [Leuciscus waleckii]